MGNDEGVYPSDLPNFDILGHEFWENIFLKHIFFHTYL